MTAPGRYIPAQQRMAAFASMLLPETERNELRARKALAEEVLSRFDIHHVEYFSWGGSNRWWNLDPQLKADHKRRTRTDIGLIAKSKRIRKAEATFAEAMSSAVRSMRKPLIQSLGRSGGKSMWAKRKLPSRPFPKAKRKLRKK